MSISPRRATDTFVAWSPFVRWRGAQSPGYKEQYGTTMADEAQRDALAGNGNSSRTTQYSGHGGFGQADSQQAQEAIAAKETLAALLRDLDSLHAYLTLRGRHTYDLAQRFLDNARRNTESRAFDERQATMLEYQHYIWHEIAGLVNKLLVTYGEDTALADDGAAAKDDMTSGDGDER